MIEGNLELYSDYLHGSVFAPASRSSATELVGDGNVKVKEKADCTATKKRAGRKRKNRKSENSHHSAWLMTCDPKEGRIMAASSMHKPECNAILQRLILAILWTYPSVNFFIYDRACSVMPAASKIVALAQILYYIVDRLHGSRHKANCKCNPHKVLRLKRQSQGVNTQICEQTFQSFRTLFDVRL